MSVKIPLPQFVECTWYFDPEKEKEYGYIYFRTPMIPRLNDKDVISKFYMNEDGLWSENDICRIYKSKSELTQLLYFNNFVHVHDHIYMHSKYNCIKDLIMVDSNNQVKEPVYFKVLSHLQNFERNIYVTTCRNPGLLVGKRGELCSCGSYDYTLFSLEEAEELMMKLQYVKVPYNNFYVHHSNINIY